MIIHLDREEFVRKGACEEGLIEFAQIAPSGHFVGYWHPLVDIWMAVALPNISAWLRQNGFIPQMDLSGHDLSGADLRGADLRGGKFHRTNFRGADLRGANLYAANLALADLTDAKLEGADMRATHLYGVKGHHARSQG